MDILHHKNWALLDIEYIQSSKDHKCFRKLYILSKDKTEDRELEFYPCIHFKDMEDHYKKSFRFCRAHIHKLSYYPEKCASPCSTATDKIKKFVMDNKIDLILYKGGCIEKQLCANIGTQSLNIETFEKLEKINSHNPQTEVKNYHEQLISLMNNSFFSTH